MALIYSTTPHDTDELVALRLIINDNERAFSGLRTIYSAWAFTEDDIQAFRDELAKRSLGIASHWQHEDGVAFQVFNARV